ncbi:hypothetical protein TD95_000682 [Thielaviopsis punctulata]|uniref:ATP-dependent RNA helicase n=1 Tax=Thielaviopsis punctulata TaxID=72032 RepID=A0A0F4ZHC4_9PEZI|nr:hypothetical protein TD95_000682 [Thielaviopsis punctulata]
MFRQGLRRCAPLRQVAARAAFTAPVASSLLAQRAAQMAIKPSVASLGRALQQFRFMATEAEAAAETEAEPAEAKEEEKATLFADIGNDGLVHPTIIRTIVKGMGYTKMSEVQARTIRPALEGKDLVAQAKTGTGKTIGFLLPTLQRMINEDPRLASRSSRHNASFGDVRGIVLSPTRELAEQIAVEAKKLVYGTGLVVQAAVGGTQKSLMLNRARREGCHLLVATPGRLLDLLQDPRSGLKAPNLAAMVLDEADRMLDVGFSDALRAIGQYLPDPAVKERQTLLFSATIPKDVVSLARSMVRPHNFEFIQTIREDEEPTHARVPQSIVVTHGWYNVIPSVVELMKREIAASKADPESLPFKAILYTPTTAMVDLLYPTLSGVTRDLGRDFSRCFIHGKLTQGQRTRAAENFRAAKSGFLISSDVTARGMDFPNVSHVIQLGLPPSAEQYVHRLGRTGRAGKTGKGFIIVPRYLLSSSRQMLGAFPINPEKTLETATIEPSESSNESHPILSSVAEAYQRADPDTFNTTYLSLLGGIERRTAEDAIASMNDLTRFGFGMSEPPFISEKSAQRLGISRLPGVNLGRRQSFDSSNSDARRSSSPYARRAPTNSDDPFSNMMSSVVDPNAIASSKRHVANFGEDEPNSGGFRGGNRGGYGGRGRDGRSGGFGGRGRSGGFSGRNGRSDRGRWNGRN